MGKEATGRRADGSDGERRVVTIMFADISGFTALADHRDAEEVHDILNDCFAVMVPIVERHGGTIDKFIGDCVMALFGAPLSHEDDPSRALQAALEMMEAFSAFAAGRNLPLDLHFGINTGPVVSAGIGHGAQRRFSVIGDAVNLAARLEDLSKPGEILIGETTAALTWDNFILEALGANAFKGKSGSVRVFRLVARKASHSDYPAEASPFVGRMNELTTLRELLEHVRGGSGAAVELVGDAGVGKSRLVDELRGSAADLRWIEVRGTAQRQSSGFGLAREVVLELLDAERTEGEALRDRIADRLGPDGTDLDRAALASIVGLAANSSDTNAFEGLSASTIEDATAQAFRKFLVEAGRRKPTVLVCEDIHWADRSSLDLVKALATGGVVPRLLALFSRRPDPDESGAMRIPGAVPMALEALSQEEAGSLLAALLDPAVDPDMRQRIVERVEGNPYFLEELVKALDDGDGNAFSIGLEGQSPSSELLPFTVQGVIMARLDRLYPEGRRTLQTASVIGRAFEVDVLSRVSRDGLETREHLPQILHDLHERDFTRPEDAAARSYRFKHGLAQEVAYDSLLFARRRILHREVACALVDRFGESSDLAATLAFHLERADLPREASVQFLRAGAVARDAHAHAEALSHFARAAELIEASPDSREPTAGGMLAEAHEGAGDVLLLRGRYAEAQERFKAALRLVPADATIKRGSLLRRCGQSRMLERDATGACEFFQQAISEFERSPDPTSSEWTGEWIRASLDMLWPLYWLGEVNKMQERIDAVRGPVAAHGTDRQRARLLDRELLLRLQIEDSKVSAATVALAEEALEMAERTGSQSAIGLASQSLGYCLMLAGRPSAALEPLARALEHAQASGHADQQILALSNLSISSRLVNDVDSCAAYSDRMLALAQSNENWIQIGVGNANLGWCAMRRGDFASANEHIDLAFSQWRDRTFRMQWLGWWPSFAIAVQHGDREAAKAAADRLLDPEQLQPPTELSRILAEFRALDLEDHRHWERAVTLTREATMRGLA